MADCWHFKCALSIKGPDREEIVSPTAAKLFVLVRTVLVLCVVVLVQGIRIANEQRHSRYTIVPGRQW